MIVLSYKRYFCIQTDWENKLQLINFLPSTNDWSGNPIIGMLPHKGYEKNYSLNL